MSLAARFAGIDRETGRRPCAWSRSADGVHAVRRYGHCGYDGGRRGLLFRPRLSVFDGEVAAAAFIPLDDGHVTGVSLNRAILSGVGRSACATVVPM
jgi:hypothetical protein